MPDSSDPQPDFVADEAAIEVGILAGTGVILSRLGLEHRP
jgi:hypothetical protein